MAAERKTHSEDFKVGYSTGYMAAKRRGQADMKRVLAEKEHEHLDVNRTFPYNIVPYITGEYSEKYLNGDDTSPHDPAEMYFAPDLMLRAMVHILTEREFVVLQLRFDQRVTLEQAGMELGVTRERVRQLETKALRKLQIHISELWCVPMSEAVALRRENERLKQLLADQKAELEEQVPQSARPIEELDLSVRSYNCLKRAGIRTFGDLCNQSENEVIQLRNLGKKSFLEICNAMQANGLHFCEADAEGLAIGARKKEGA